MAVEQLDNEYLGPAPEFAGVLDKILQSTPDNQQTNSTEQDYTSLDIMELHLREANQHPLLTFEQEVFLAQQYERGEEAKRSLENSDGKLNSSLDNLLQIVKKGEEAKEKMQVSNLRLVVSVAKKYMGRGMPLLDLIQEGNISLGRAVDKYNWRLNFRFSTYAYWWIRQAVTRAIADQSRTIKIPVHVFEQLSKFSEARRQLAIELEGEPTTAELASYMDMSEEQVRALERSLTPTCSLDQVVYHEEDDGLTLAEVVADDKTLPVDEQAMHRMQKKDVLDHLSHLSLREQFVLKRRFGLDGSGEPESLTYLGKALGVSRERVRQIEGEALQKLRDDPDTERLDYD